MGSAMPTLQTWLEVNQRADKGLLMVLVLAVLTLVWLAEMKWVAPRLLPLFRGIVTWSYLVGLIAIFAVTVATGGLKP